MEGAGAGGDAFASATAPLTWHDFLERMRHPSAAEFVKSIKSFIVTFSNNTPDPEVDSNAVQDFLASMEDAFRAHSLWAGSSDEELESAGEGLEKYVMTKLHNRVFATVPEDARSDDELFEKMGLLQHFIRPENLDIRPEFQNESSWLLAQKELQKINLYKAPRDKLVCILNCCKVINNLLVNASLASDQNAPGADEFLPVLIYVTIKANPPQLHSNLQYIQRFRRRTRLVSESAYYFTNILSAESFVWNIDGEALSMDEADFQRKMEAAREHLLGLSPPSGPSESDKVTSENSPAQVNDTLRGDGTRDLENEGRAVGAMETKQPSVEIKQPTAQDLQKKGSSELLKEDSVTRYFQEYPYLFARAGDLTVSDVENLLSSYKRLVLQYVSLSKGIGVNPETHHHTTEPVKQSLEAEDPPKNTDTDETKQVTTVETQLSTETIDDSGDLVKHAEGTESEVVDSITGCTDSDNTPDGLVTGSVESKKSEDA
ncbi:Vacuolar protein sorting-associated protein 9A [Rhynchospora pubera]|uniref:Vacuolar protein sorting-associated protein 9A n=1 Tax=Rhynchospora pubera TaxID=906938 RepID=A0AAV8FW22_9POAL|nr:Vacuolar protein sorting-associated protein 9A [Rhynchospora pubera]KAJ4796270.1 Vacuolar protein sorting-associated protein 9A [Rhynchospora pubera]